MNKVAQPCCRPRRNRAVGPEGTHGQQHDHATACARVAVQVGTAVRWCTAARAPVHGRPPLVFRDILSGYDCFGGSLWLGSLERRN